MATIVFVGHEATRSGAPFTQLYMMRWIKANTSHKMVLVLLKGGDLTSEFEKLADVYPVDYPKFPFHDRVWSKLNRLSGRDHSNTINKIGSYKPDIIFVNSLAAINYGLKLKEKLNIKLICNIHELETSFFYAKPDWYTKGILNADRLMMGSHAVKKFYLDSFPVNPNKVSVIYDFTDDEHDSLSSFVNIRDLYSIPTGAKIVGGMGSLNWRKGYDLFLYTAAKVLEKSRDTYFIWVGGDKKFADYKQLEREAKLLGIHDRVILAGEQADIKSYYKAFDVFLLTSREDPFPLVCLEAAMAQTPLICFKNSGGMPEFVRDDAGFVVDYVNLDQMADKTLSLLNDETLRKQMGAVARERALNNHTIGKLGPSILELIEETI